MYILVINKYLNGRVVSLIFYYYFNLYIFVVLFILFFKYFSFLKKFFFNFFSSCFILLFVGYKNKELDKKKKWNGLNDICFVKKIYKIIIIKKRKCISKTEKQRWMNGSEELRRWTKTTAFLRRNFCTKKLECVFVFRLEFLVSLFFILFFGFVSVLEHLLQDESYSLNCRWKTVYYRIW